MPDAPSLAAVQNLYKDFESLDMAEKVLTPCRPCFAVPCPEKGWLLRPATLDLQVVKLKSFSKFENTTDALAAATALTDSKLSKSATLCNLLIE